MTGSGENSNKFVVIPAKAWSRVMRFYELRMPEV
jgi:hypothetical protein